MVIWFLKNPALFKLYSVWKMVWKALELGNMMLILYTVHALPPPPNVISILQIRWGTFWMVQTDAYRSPEVGSVVFYPLELVGHFAVRGSQIGESWFFWLYFRNFKITPKLSLEGPFYLTHVCREWNGLSNGILEICIFLKIIGDNGRFFKNFWKKNRTESQNRHFFRKPRPCRYTHWPSRKTT